MVFGYSRTNLLCAVEAHQHGSNMVVLVNLCIHLNSYTLVVIAIFRHHSE